MKRLWCTLAVLLIAATTDENRQFRVAQAAFDDKLHDVAERQLAEFLQKYPQSERADNAQFRRMRHEILRLQREHLRYFRDHRRQLIVHIVILAQPTQRSQSLAHRTA